jgi:hypothetical protein
MMWQPHLPPRRRVWVFPVLLVVLLAGHGVILYYLSSHVMLSAAVLSVAIVLLLIKHVGPGACALQAAPLADGAATQGEVGAAAPAVLRPPCHSRFPSGFGLPFPLGSCR